MLASGRYRHPTRAARAGTPVPLAVLQWLFFKVEFAIRDRRFTIYGLLFLPSVTPTNSAFSFFPPFPLPG